MKSSDFKAADNWTGLRYVDANAYLPAKTILVAIAAICALLFFATLWRRTWQLPVIGFGLMVLSAILIGGLYPAIVQKFQVQPNEQAKESPYVEKNIKATRDAYAIAGTDVKDYPGVPNAGTNKDQLRKTADTTASIRLLDPNIVSPAFQQLQQVKGYYAFPSTLAVDRYSGQDTVIGLRELNIGGIPKNNWINDHFRYTHGFGVVAAKGNTATDKGAPDFTQSDLPSKGMFGTDFEQRIYYGEQTKQYSIVGGPQKELDYSDDKGEKETSYKGDSGVNLDNPVNRAAYALAFSEPQILYSGAIGEGSRILYNRTPKERVEAVAPWLTIDGAPYPAVVDGKVKWIVDAYTTTNGYPYASRTTLGDSTTDSLTNSQRAVVAQENQVNYIRNSVKATVDAYDGTVNLYQWDTEDPVLKTWMKAFPGTVKPKSAIDKALMDHLRYPQDLFKVQRELLTRYHVTDPQTFLSGSEAWQVPNDPTTKDGTAVPPYYLSMKMPEQKEKDQVFSLTTTFTPNGRDNLSAFMAVNADPGTSDYGKIRLLKLPTSSPVDGPKQVQSKFNSETKIAESIRLLRGGDSEVEYGNLLTVPLDGGMLYVEPVYVRSSGLKYPLLRKVLVTYGGQTAFEDTLEKALNVVFGAEAPTVPTTPTPPTTPPGEGTTTPPTSQDPTVKAALDDAQKAVEAAEKARQAGDWTAFGKAQDDIKAALKRAIDAEAKLTTPKPGG